MIDLPDKSAVIVLALDSSQEGLGFVVLNSRILIALNPTPSPIAKYIGTELVIR